MTHLEIGWSDTTPRVRSAAPWWVGLDPSPRRHGWSPSGEALRGAVTASVRRAVHFDAWLGRPSRLESIMIGLTREPLWPGGGGYLGTRDGAAACQLVVPDRIATATSLAVVHGWLHAEALAALTVIGEKLRLGPPVLRAAHDAADSAHAARGRVSSLSPRPGEAARIYTSPRYRDRARVRDALSRVAVEDGSDGGWGRWAMSGDVAVRTAPPTAGVADFMALSAPTRLDELAATELMVLVDFDAAALLGSRRRTAILRRCRTVAESGPFRLTTVGLDERMPWAVFRWGRVSV